MVIIQGICHGNNTRNLPNGYVRIAADVSKDVANRTDYTLFSQA